MTTATRRLAPLLVAGVVAGLVLAAPRRAAAISLDHRGEMKLGLRAYTDVRIGTQRMGDEDNPLTWPRSPAGHVRQSRYFLQLKFDHDLTRLARESTSWLRLFGLLNLDDFGYSLQYRGEFEGIYDYGPSEFSDGGDKMRALRLDAPNAPPISTDRLPAKFISDSVDRLRRRARHSNQLYLAYVDMDKGPLSIRAGKQILAWGETDVFRLLDNINPLDNGFGGFFIALDERRIPVGMVRASWNFGQLGPLADSFLEGFVAQGDVVSQVPGIPSGSPWSPGGFGFPRPQLLALVPEPDFWDVRGGGRFVFTWKDVTYTLAHYYTYLDIPGSQFKLPGAKDGLNTARYDNPIIAFGRYPRVPITGASATFPVPSWYTIVRTEVAWFKNEPVSRQGIGNDADALGAPGSPGYRRLQRQNNTAGGLDPFVYPGFLDLARQNPSWGTVLQLDTFNMAIGFDVNRFIRWINPNQTVFFSAQLFYKHYFDSPGDLVLPVPYRNLPVSRQLPIVGTPGCDGGTRGCMLRPRLFHLEDDRFTNTLLISTSYSGGRIVPSLGFLYDWAGPRVVQPGVAFVRDPFRVIFDYSYVGGPPTSEIGTMRDRDTVRFQVEYVF